MAQGLTRSLPKGPEQQHPPPSNLTTRPARADYLFPWNAHAPHQRISNSLTMFCSEYKTNNTGNLDNSGVQAPLLPSPQAMAHESNQRKMQLRCSPYENGNQGLVSKGSRQGSQAAGQPVNFNPVLSVKIKWRLSTRHQSFSCSNSVLREGVLQDEGTASSAISNTAGRLHDETRPEGCILRTSN